MPLNVALLRKVQAIIREEPRRLYMGAWHLTDPGAFMPDPPPCGTAACIGGWARLIAEREAEKTLPIFSSFDFVRLFLAHSDPTELRDDVSDLLLGYPWPEDEHVGLGPWLGERLPDADAAIRAIDRVIAKWDPKATSAADPTDDETGTYSTGA